MAPSDMILNIQRWGQKLSRLDYRKHAGIWWRAVVKTGKPDTYLSAAAIAYFSLFSIFPLVLLIVAIASLWLDPLRVETMIVENLEFLAPDLGQLLGKNLRQIVVERSSVTGFALVSLFWAASTMFNALTRALDKIFTGYQTRSIWESRGLAILFVILISAAMVFVSFSSSTMTTLLRRLLPEDILALYSSLSQITTLLLSVLLFGFLYRFLPQSTTTWSEILPGALAAGFLWEQAKSAFLWYTTHYFSLSNLVYGSVTAIVVFLAWVYVSALIFFFGAHLSVLYRDSGLQEAEGDESYPGQSAVQED